MSHHVQTSTLNGLKLKFESPNYETSRRKHKLQETGLGSDYFGYNPKSTDNDSKNNKWDGIKL